MLYQRGILLLTLFFVLFGACSLLPENEKKEYVGLLPDHDKIPGVTNFAKISNALYRGAQPTKLGFEELKKAGIKTIVNLRSYHCDFYKIQGQGFRYFHIPCQAHWTKEKRVAQFLKIMENKENYPVFVHCKHGADRTGLMVAAYRMYYQKWPREKAISELSPFGFHGIWRNIKKYLRKFSVEKMKEKVKSLKPLQPKIVK